MKLVIFLFFTTSLYAQVTLENKQIVLVITDSWSSTHAHVYRLGRSDDNTWQLTANDPIPAVVGKSGLAWGRGLHPEKDLPPRTPRKEEGDGKAPAGIFDFGQSFGYDKLPETFRLPSLQLLPGIECIDDPESAYYNKIVDKKLVLEPDWKSSEEMRRKDESYRYGIVINHNMPPEKSKGSCIFFHVWSGPDSSTAGCTASHEFHVKTLQSWLDEKKKPLLIQLPWSEYLKFREAWKLPDVPKPLFI